MSIITIIIVLIVVGFLLWLINRYIPMQSVIKTILNVLIVIIVILWLLNEFDVVNILDLHLTR